MSRVGTLDYMPPEVGTLLLVSSSCLPVLPVYQNTLHYGKRKCRVQFSPAGAHLARRCLSWPSMVPCLATC